jgi:hypothetical protein
MGFYTIYMHIERARRRMKMIRAKTRRVDPSAAPTEKCSIGTFSLKILQAVAKIFILFD